VVLHLLRLPYVREGRTIGQVIEYSGEAILDMTTDERATLTGMAAEVGGFCGIVAPDAETLTFLRERRGLLLALDPWMRSDPGAEFIHTIEVDCSALERMPGQPGDPGNGIEVSRLPVPVHASAAPAWS
jgi:3-isopropylmalate/(R)-2-methylmalate dehydratase large subunit